MEIKGKHVWYIILIIVLFTSLFINLNVSLTEPLIFGDEGWWASRGKWILNNLEIPKYTEILSQSEAFRSFFLEQPIFMFLVSSAFLVGGEMLVKALNPILGFLLGIVVFLFARRVYSTKIGVLSTLFLIMFPSFITYQVLLYSEVFAILMVTVAIYFFYRGFEEDRKILFFVLGGILSGIAAITEVGSIIMPLVFLFIFVLYKKNWLRNFSLVLGIFLVLFIPLYGIHNYLLLGNPGLPRIDDIFGLERKEILKDLPEGEFGKLRTPTEVGGGTGSTILNMGIVNYIDFAYDLVPFVFASIGLAAISLSRKRKDILIAGVFVLFLLTSFLATSAGRSEDAARNMLYIVPFLSIFCGLGTFKIYEFLKNYGENTGKVMGIMFVFILLCFSLLSAQAKAESLRPIKEFSPAFFNGCDWIRRNTPEGSLLVTLWQHRARYACERDSIYASSPGGEEMLLAGNETTYEIMKLHGADYVYIQKFSVQPGRDMVSYPWVFVRYVQNSDHFEKVYEYPQNCMFSNNQDCVVVYKVL